ncbi:MAG: hypothetical protein VX527_13055 [Planctomycetota bacterium]|nr:hypothetical protein [Planctomycetota bacterium]
MTTLGLIIACLFAQQPAMPPADELYIVNADNAVIRCGGDRNYYAFVAAPPQSLVHVKEEMANWGRVPAHGPLFAEAWGWIRHATDEPGRFTVVDERTGTTLDTMPVYAPDLMNPEPTKAWRPVCMLSMDSRVDILDSTTEILDGKTYHFYKIRLPKQAEGWINMANLRPATTEEALAWSGSTISPSIETVVMQESEAASPAVTVDRIETPVGQPSYLARYLANQRAVKTVVIVEEPGEEYVVESGPVVVENNYFKGLEQLYTSVPATDMSDDLISRLWEAYAIVAEEDVDSDPESAQLASIRMRQLELAICLRDQQRSIEDLNAVVDLATRDVSVVRQSIDAPIDYAVIGRLNVSSIFTGSDGRPVMYRVEDPTSGRTLAYLEPNVSLDLAAMIGQWIGVVGPMNFDSRWQVQVIAPQRVDLVAANIY